MISTTTINAAPVGNQAKCDQELCQRIPKEYVRIARASYQEKQEQQRFSPATLLKQIFNGGDLALSLKQMWA